MLIAAIIIYCILCFFAGPLWPIDMFFKAGCLGKLFVAGWVALLIGGIGS